MTFQYLGSARTEMHGYSEAFLKTASPTPEEIASAREGLQYEIVIKRCDKSYECSRLTLSELVPLWGD